MVGCLALFGWPESAAAWSKTGHEIVGAIAEERLTPAARSIVRELVGDEPLSEPAISVWADLVKDSRTRRWHYVNIPFTAEAYDARRDCPGSACAVAAIDHFKAVLENGASTGERAEALRWIVHLVADIHQPLHAGNGWDRGGNQFRVRIGRRKQPTNFHRVWDSEVLKPLVQGRGPIAAARDLADRIAQKDAHDWSADLRPSSWAIESSREARALYAELDRQPTDTTILHLPADYAQTERARTARQLERAGVRLAALLDEVARHRGGAQVAR